MVNPKSSRPEIKLLKTYKEATSELSGETI